MSGVKIIDKLTLLYVKDKRVLFVRSSGKEIFYTVGGKREAIETDEEALIREVKEEIGVDLITDTIKYLNTFTDKADGKENTIVKLTCYSADFTGTPTPNSEIEEIGWLNTKDKEKTSPTGVLVLDWLHDRELID